MTNNRRTVFLTDGGEVEKDYPGVVAAVLGASGCEEGLDGQMVAVGGRDV